MARQPDKVWKGRGIDRRQAEWHTLEAADNYRKYRPYIARAVSETIHNLLLSENWTGRTSELAIKVYDTQIATHNSASQLTWSIATNFRTWIPTETLFGLVAARLSDLLVTDPQSGAALVELPEPIFARIMHTLCALPYRWILAHRKRFIKGLEDLELENVDDWIIGNEWFLRTRNYAYNLPAGTSLVTLEDLHHIPHSELIHGVLKITRPKLLTGLTLLEKARKAFIYVQPNITAYQRAFNKLSYGQLAGMNWSNVLVAGGLALASLLCVERHDAVNVPVQWRSSDIDIYIYGLDAVQANDKIEHIFEIFKRNLPQKKPCVAVKNSKTVTFICEYPRRRVQIVLKLVTNPVDVLLNFDLDICAIGYDGNQVYMLPRTARALETGFNVFTMDMLEGHYLGDRRATQEHRVFKYASKGYGIRILSGYLNALSTIDPSTLPREANYNSDIPHYIASSKPSLAWHTKIAEAKGYFENVFSRYMDQINSGGFLKTHYGYPRSNYRFGNARGTVIEPVNGVPRFTHALLDTTYQFTAEPMRRSCLSGFELFYRHVHLWDAEQDGRVIVDDSVWAASTYDEIAYGQSYDNTLQYKWDETFTLKSLREYVKSSNYPDQKWVDWDVPEKITAQRTVVSSSITDLLRPTSMNNYVTRLPRKFASFANQTISTALRERGYLYGEPTVIIIDPDETAEEESLLLALVQINPYTMWQKLDRRVDEIFEILWSYIYSTVNNRWIDDEDQVQRFMRQLSQRAIRQKPADEYRAFASWIAREPGSIAGFDYGGPRPGFWGDCFPEPPVSEEDDEEEEGEQEEEEEEEEEGGQDIQEDEDGGNDDEDGDGGEGVAIDQREQPADDNNGTDEDPQAEELQDTEGATDGDSNHSDEDEEYVTENRLLRNMMLIYMMSDMI